MAEIGSLLTGSPRQVPFNDFSWNRNPLPAPLDPYAYGGLSPDQAEQERARKRAEEEARMESQRKQQQTLQQQLLMQLLYGKMPEFSRAGRFGGYQDNGPGILGQLLHGALQPPQINFSQMGGR